MTTSLAETYLSDVIRKFRGIKKLGDGAFAQTSDDDFFRVLDPESNSIALIVKHVVGNMRSRFRDFLTSDGEKPDRNRDMEFILEGEDRKTLIAAWEEEWKAFLGMLESLTPEDLTRMVTIRHEPYVVVAALNRQVEHYAYHTGQIVFLAKHFKSQEWHSLSIPRGASQSFNEKMKDRFGRS